MRVPPEILNSIIDEVAVIDDDKKSTLKTCAVASSQFLHACRKHIFQSISITFNATDNGDDTPRNLGLHEILEQTTVLSEYIHALFVKSNPATVAKFRNDTLLGYILNNLPNIYFLSVEFLLWSGIPSSLQQSIFKLLCSPNLSEVHLSVFNLPPIFVKCLQGIPSVHADKINFLPDTNSDSLYEYPQGLQKRLTCLHMPSQLSERSMPLMQLVSSTGYHLETLKLLPVMLLRSDGPGTDVLPVALARHGRTLKDLNISAITTEVDLSKMVNVERLALFPMTLYDQNSDGMEHLVKTLLTVPPTNRIRELNISTNDVHLMAVQEGILKIEDFEQAGSEEGDNSEQPAVDFNAMGAAHGIPGHRVAAVFARYMFPRRVGDGPLPHWKRLDEILTGSTFPMLERVTRRTFNCQIAKIISLSNNL